MTSIKTKQRIWEFGPFRLDEADRSLLRDGRPVSLTPKVFDTLIVFLERAGRLVEKNELMTRLWPDTFVEEGALTRNISDLRKALGEEKYVETVPKRGYRFVAPVREISDESAILIVEEAVEAQVIIEEENERTPATPSVPERQMRFSHSLKPRLATALASIVLIAGAALGWREFTKPRRASNEPRPAIPAMHVGRFTASGNILTAAISPDGKYVATVLDEGGLQSLWVRQVAANTSGVRVIAPALVEYVGLTFSNDSNFIYYVSWMRNQSDPELYQLPVLGGTPRRIPVPDIDTPISFSPAGDRFAYVFTSSSRGETYVKVAGADGAGVQTLVKRRKPGFIAAWPGGPAWAPDGGFIAYAGSGAAEDDIQQMRVFVASVADRTERQLSGRSWRDIGRVAWLGDGSGLVIAAREEKDAPRQLWFIPYPGGAARKITNDLHDYDNLSLSGDAKTLVAVLRQPAFSIAIMPHDEGKQADPGLSRTIFSEVGSDVGDGIGRLAWTPDNRLVYCSRAGGNWDIWVMNKDGSERRQLTLDAHNDLFPTVSGDGRYIFFASDRAGAFNIWRMEIDGSHLTQLTRGDDQTLSEVTPDGYWLIYQQNLGPANPTIWRMPATGGEAQCLTCNLRLAQRPAISPDGRLLAYVDLDDKGWGVAIQPFKPGEVARRFLFPPTIGSRNFRWTPDGQALSYVVNEKGASNIWLQALGGAPPSQLTNFKTGQLLTFAWSPDGQWLACMRQATTSDVVLLQDFK